MKILGVDPGKVNMAICLLDENNKDVPFFTFKLKPIEHENNAYRLYDLEKKLQNCINWSEIDLISHEGISFGEVYGVAESGMVQYIIQRVAISNGINFITIPPPTLKRFLEIKTPKGGKSKGKTDLALAVYKKWSIDFPSQDETDAFILAQLGLAVLKKEFELTTSKKKKVKSV